MTIRFIATVLVVLAVAIWLARPVDDGRGKAS
jgi:hypothetical protein